MAAGWNRVDRPCKDYTDRLGTAKTVQELSTELGLPVERVQKTLDRLANELRFAIKLPNGSFINKGV